MPTRNLHAAVKSWRTTSSKKKFQKSITTLLIKVRGKDAKIHKATIKETI